MRRFVRLADLSHIETPRHAEYSAALLSEARAAVEAVGLRYDNARGTVANNRSGVIERYVNPSDHVPLESEEDVMRWVFSRHINNAASRIKAGYPA